MSTRSGSQLEQWYEYELEKINRFRGRPDGEYDRLRYNLDRELNSRRRDEMERECFYPKLDPIGMIRDPSQFQNVWNSKSDYDQMRNAFIKDEQKVRERYKKKAPPEPEERTESETKSAFLTMMGGAGFRKDLPIRQRIEHEMELGELEVVKAKREELVKKALKKAQPPPPKRLCGICGDPCCPWSD